MEHKGWPQFDPNIFSPQLVWLAITFIVLYVMMSRFALPRVSSVLEETPRGASTATSKRRNPCGPRAQAAADAYEKTLAEARARTQVILKEARDKMAAEAAGQIRRPGRAPGRPDRRGRGANRQGPRGPPWPSCRRWAAEVAGTAVARLTGETANARTVKAAVTATLKERV